jgi:hypothetical protein
MRKSLENARELLFFAIIGDEFTQIYSRELRVAFQQGLNCKILVAEPSSEYIKNLWKLRGFPHVEEVRARIQRLKTEWEQIVASGREPAGSIEIRHFSTEITNQVVICKRKDGNYIAWVTLALPLKRAVDCMQIEFVDKDRIKECKSYFNCIWNLHDSDVLYSYPSRRR